MPIRFLLCLLVGHFAFGSALPVRWPESRPLHRFSHSGPKLPSQFSGRSPARPVFIYSDKGVWDDGLTHLQWFFSEHELSYRLVSATDILAGILTAEPSSLLVMPGGESWEYLDSLGTEGGNRIKAYVALGGGYLGICAGAFYATSHRLGGAGDGAYGIGLLEGEAFDGTALEAPSFIEGMMSFRLVPGPLTDGFGERLQIVLFGGPSFRVSAEEMARKRLRNLAFFEVFQEPAMVAFDYDKGRVFLSGPHLEIEEPRTDWAEFVDPDSEWPLLERLVRWLSKYD